MKSVLNNISEMKNRSISIIGLGQSGVAVAQLANYLGAKVFISDSTSSKFVKKNLALLKSIGINGEIGGHSENIYKTNLMVISPGVPADSKVVTEAINRRIKVVGEIEFASLFTESPIVGVTGSNGKSTTVHALAKMCQTDQVHGILAGNVGLAFSNKVLEELHNPDPKRVYILEISSFQMEFVEKFHPFISIFLNISPDHLDRHKTFENYLSTKLRLAKNQTINDYIIYNSMDVSLVQNLNKNYPTKKLTFGTKYSDNSIYSLKNSNIINKECAKLTQLKDIGLPGQHNILNLLAAATGAHCLGISDEKISEVMETFNGIPHRLETIANINGIEFVNDSKATNIDAVKVAIESYEKPIILILGGLAKGNNFAELASFKNKIEHIFAYGNARSMIHSELSPKFSVTTIELLQDTVKLSCQKAKDGEIVLLSPGCASFDQFKNFEDRGNQFSAWVRELNQ